MKRRTLMTALPAATLGLAACGPQSETGKGPSVLRVLAANFSADNEGQDTFQKIVDVFHKSYPDIQVQPDFTPYDSLNQKISTALASGDNFDVISAGIGWVQPMADLGAIQSLSALGVDRSTLEEAVYPAFVDPMVWDDEIYALPVVANPRLVAYSRAAFETSGLDPDRPPQSMDELREYAQQLTVRDGGDNITQVGFDFWAPPSNYRQQFVGFMGALGGEAFAEGDPTFNQEPGVDALELIAQMVNVDRSSVYGYQNSAQTALVTTGEAAMGFVGPYADCSDEGLGDKCDDLAYFNLMGTREAMYVGGRVATVGEGTDHPEESLAFARAFQDVSVQEAISVMDVGVPVSIDEEESDFVTSNPATEFAWANLQHGVFEYGGESFLDFRAEFGPALDEVILGQAGAQETLDRLADVARQG
ncbi:extracellular solute-binding protein [Brachybacterium alimentarium]|uniref:extracellular solute-binding protein n=1 Tax=Brachybacterium alimentarium TaxID=47845 RepID=UPI003FD67B62